MAQLVKLFDEKKLLVTMQADTLVLIRNCRTIETIKGFVACYDVLKLTWTIQEKFPTDFPDEPECDEGALLHLQDISSELLFKHGPELPRPGFDSFYFNIKKLLRLFRVPRKGLTNVKIQEGRGEGRGKDDTTAPPNMPALYGLDASHGGPDPKA